jgi:MORN repeat
MSKEVHRRSLQSTSNHSPVSELSDDEGSTNSAIVIPLDDSVLSSSLIRSGMKHVVEWQWTNRKSVLGLYTGWVDLAGNPHGHGTWRIEDGSIYDGEWKRGLRDGKCFTKISRCVILQREPTFLYHSVLVLSILKGVECTRQSMAISTVEDGEMMHKTGGESMCGLMAKCLPETMCMVFAKAKGM